MTSRLPDPLTAAVTTPAKPEGLEIENLGDRVRLMISHALDPTLEIDLPRNNLELAACGANSGDYAWALRPIRDGDSIDAAATSVSSACECSVRGDIPNDDLELAVPGSECCDHAVRQARSRQ
jgi:hypothetical protein